MSTTKYDQSSPSLHQEIRDAPSDTFHLSGCALLSDSSEWTTPLEQLGLRVFRRPESLYNALRTREFFPEACIVDLDTIPRSLVKAVDLRVPCPKLWVGKSASNPSDIKNFGIYYSRARPDELNTVISRLIQTDRSMLLPSGIVSSQLLPLLVIDHSYHERLHRYTELFSAANLITLHGDDTIELQLVAQYLAVESRRPRIWEIKSESSFHSTLRRIAQARRPGTDVSILLLTEVGVEAAREFHQSIPAEYSVIKLSTRVDNPVGDLSFTVPRPVERPRDIENWVTWFVCRATIEYGIALSDMPGLVRSVTRMLGDNPQLDDIRSVCERSIRQHATLMEDHGEYTSYDDLVHNYERTILKQALVKNDWNLSATARSLGLAESSLRYKLNRLGLLKGSNDRD